MYRLFLAATMGALSRQLKHFYHLKIVDAVFWYTQAAAAFVAPLDPNQCRTHQYDIFIFSYGK
jgi:hypothetical protein